MDGFFSGFGRVLVNVLFNSTTYFYDVNCDSIGKDRGRKRGKEK